MTREHPVSTLRSPLARWLAVAFVAVSVGAVFVLAGLTIWRTRYTVGQLAADRRQATTEAIARTLALSYGQSGSWPNTDSHPATMLAIQDGASIRVADLQGREVTLRSSMGPMTGMSDMGSMAGGAETAGGAVAQPSKHRVERRAPIVLGTSTVGTVIVTFGNGELAEAEQHVRDALRGTVLLGALIAALAALAVAVPLARRVIAPVTRITNTARRLGDGDITARVEHHDAPGELGLLARTFDDMAERLQAHETTRRNLTADLAHELRTPLTLLQGSCEELLDGTSPPDLACFAALHDDILRMRRLVDDLALLAEADAATTEGTAHHVAVDLSALATTIAARVRPLIDANGHQLTVDSTPVSVIGDAGQLAQAITNLLTNSIKYTPSGGHITLTVGPGAPTATATDTASATAVLTVADDGPGIAEVDRPHILERFYRADRTRHVAGTGIGLAVAHQLVTAHHGTITFDRPEKGTEVRLELPAVGDRAVAASR